MEIIKKTLAASVLALSLSTPALAGSEPVLGFASVGTPYGAFGCKQRAETKLFAIGATNITKSPNSSSIWANFGGTHSVGIWCRGPEVIIIVGGEGNITDLRDEIRTAF